MKKILISSITLLLLGTMVLAQQEKTAEVNKYADDHKSIDSIMKATYDVISGEKAEKRDWDRFRALFHPDARLIPTNAGRARAFTPDEYIQRSEPFMMNQGFFEEEIARRVDVFGSVAQVFSTYEARNSKADKEPFMRGINSFQLLNDGKRWWVMTIYWQQESEKTPIPAKYLKSKKN